MTTELNVKLPQELLWLDGPSSEFSPYFRQATSDLASSLIHPVFIDDVKLPNNLVLAPMAGVTDGSFRLLCTRLGVGHTISELASAKAITMGSRQTIDILLHQGQQRPYSVQLFGADPGVMAEAAAIVDNLGICDIIDINMGCPVSKVVKTGAGSALMKTPDLAAEIIKRVASAVKVPVTVKFRLGWTQDSINVEEFTHKVLEAGARAITIHGRTRHAMYTGQAQWEYFKNIKSICGNIPFFANGDIMSIEDIKTLKENYGCDGYMIGRGCIGKPWLFAELLGHNLFNDNVIRYKIMEHHLIDSLIEHGPQGVPLFRVHLFGYLKNHLNASRIRHALSVENSPNVILSTIKSFYFPNN
jgi:tRNA-dihydrouridine synthase B